MSSRLQARRDPFERHFHGWARLWVAGLLLWIGVAYVLEHDPWSRIMTRTVKILIGD